MVKYIIKPDTIDHKTEFQGEVNLGNVNITGGTITGITDLAIADGGTGASTAANARTNLDAQEDLSGATITSATVASTDKVLIQDVDAADALKTVTAQSIADLGGFTEEAVEDIVGGMITGNTETLISVTYDDADGTLDFIVNEAGINHNSLTNTHNLTTDIDHNTLTNTHNLTTDINHNLLTNTHNLTTDIDHDALTNFVANEHIDWTSTTSALSTSGTVATGALTTTGNIIVTGTVDGRDVASDGSKLDGIEALADVTDETNVTDALDGATLTAATIATNDKVLIQDTDGADVLKTVTTQEIANLAAPLDASYLTLNTNASLTAERVLTSGVGIAFTDGGAGSTLTVDTNSNYFLAYLGAGGQTLSNATVTKINGALELYDDIGNYDNVTNYRWTPTVAGLYLTFAGVLFSSAASGLFHTRIHKNGSSLIYTPGILINGGNAKSVTESLVEMNGSTDYLELFGFQTSGGNLSVLGSATELNTFIGAILITKA